jgi:hypothetical protein
MLWRQPVVDVHHDAICLVGKPDSMGLVRVQITDYKAAAMKIDQGVERALRAMRGVRPNYLNRNVAVNSIGFAINGALFNDAFGEIGLGVKKPSNISSAFTADGATMGR